MPKSLCRLNRNRSVRRPLLFPLVGIVGIQLLFGAFSNVEAQEANNPSLEVVLAELRRLVSEDRWSDALRFTRRTSGSVSGFEWDYFAPYIYAAATRMDDEPQQKKGRAEAAVMLGLFEKAMDNYKFWASLSKSEHDRRSAHSGLAKCAWAAACAAVREGDYGAASQHLDIMRDYGQTWLAEEGVKKGSLVRKLMEEPNSVAAKAQPHETQRHIMDTSDSRQVAIVRLGRHYQDKGEYAKALEYFRVWAPQSWCGNCAAQFAYERDLYIAQCLVALGNAEQALRENLMPHSPQAVQSSPRTRDQRRDTRATKLGLVRDRVVAGG